MSLNKIGNVLQFTYNGNTTHSTNSVLMQDLMYRPATRIITIIIIIIIIWPAKHMHARAHADTHTHIP